jgi:hypothetical protein
MGVVGSKERKLGFAVAVLVAMTPAAAASADLGGAPRSGVPQPGVQQRGYPDQGSIAAARRYLNKRAGNTSFAVVDTDGVVSGVRVHRRFPSASVVKAMLLVAYLRRLESQNLGLGGRDKAILHRMIHVSDNNAATIIFNRIGQQRGLRSLARAAHMKNFSPNSVWGLTQISAADQCRYFLGMDDLIPAEFRDYARLLLSHISRRQSWGIPAAARPRGWSVFFKGGWVAPRARLANQAARLERTGAKIGVAVLTNHDPSMRYGVQTIRGVTARLLQEPPPKQPPPVG